MPTLAPGAGHPRSGIRQFHDPGAILLSIGGPVGPFVVGNRHNRKASLAGTRMTAAWLGVAPVFVLWIAVATSQPAVVATSTNSLPGLAPGFRDGHPGRQDSAIGHGVELVDKRRSCLPGCAFPAAGVGMGSAGDPQNGVSSPSGDSVLIR